jgi:hypothetical protein
MAPISSSTYKLVVIFDPKDPDQFKNGLHAYASLEKAQEHLMLDAGPQEKKWILAECLITPNPSKPPLLQEGSSTYSGTENKTSPNRLLFEKFIKIQVLKELKITIPARNNSSTVFKLLMDNNKGTAKDNTNAPHSGPNTFSH